MTEARNNPEAGPAREPEEPTLEADGTRPPLPPALAAAATGEPAAPEPEDEEFYDPEVDRPDPRNVRQALAIISEGGDTRLTSKACKLLSAASLQRPGGLPRPVRARVFVRRSVPEILLVPTGPQDPKAIPLTWATNNSTCRLALKGPLRKFELAPPANVEWAVPVSARDDSKHGPCVVLSLRTGLNAFSAREGKAPEQNQGKA